MFLSIKEYRGLLTFLEQVPISGIPRVLILLGTIKSGKSALINDVIEPLVAALREDDPVMRSRLPPVFFKFEFDKRCDAEAAAQDLVYALTRFARSYGISVAPAAGPALSAMADIAGDAAKAFGRRGYELWLLIDEAQGPIVGSTVSNAGVFKLKFKKVCHASVREAFLGGVGVNSQSHVSPDTLQSNRVRCSRVCDQFFCSSSKIARHMDASSSLAAAWQRF
jgi:hypothetical protein